jgi:hypothetical protein
MIRPEQIPDEVWKATGLPEIAARATVAAALNAWPNSLPTTTDDAMFVCRPALILPLPKEPRT